MRTAYFSAGGPSAKPMPTNVNTRYAAARAFVRSLNILLKFARMYDFGHPRTAKQYETAWSELRIALGAGPAMTGAKLITPSRARRVASR